MCMHTYDVLAVCYMCVCMCVFVCACTHTKVFLYDHCLVDEYVRARVCVYMLVCIHVHTYVSVYMIIV